MITKNKGKQILRKIIERYEKLLSAPSLKIYLLSEQDYKTKFITPMLEAFNWNIYDHEQVREEKFFSDLQPDYTLIDTHGKRLFVEVKPDYSERKLTGDLEKYARHKEIRKEATTVILTSFAKTTVCILGKIKGCDKADFSFEEYLSHFDDLWERISNTETGHKRRTHAKAWASRRVRQKEC